jgi:TnpA family transposase
LFLKSFSFYSNNTFNSLLDAIDIINTLNETNKRKLPDDATLDFVPAKWMPFVLDKSGNVNKNFYELSLLSLLKDGLKSGNIYVKQSRYFSDPSTYLLDYDKWNKLEVEICKQINLSIDGNVRLNNRVKDTSECFNILNKLLNTPDKVRLEKGELIVTPLEAQPKLDSLKGLEELIDERLPEIDLCDLLIEVDGWVKYSDYFQHADPTDSKPDLRYLYASIMGIASNLGLTRMAQISSLNYNRLSYISNWYIREESIKSSSDTVVNYHYHIPLSRFWGNGSLSSSDGYAVEVSGKIRNAQYLSRKFGPKKGLFFYSWTGDIYSQYGSKVISANVRDATYVLDGILNNETELSIAEHTTDTAGYTYIVFALFDLLGLKFSPRIRDLKDQSLFRVDDKKYKNLESRIKGKINTKLILDNWDELKRIAGSLKIGWVTASLYISKLQSYPRKNVMTKVLQEYGKLIKTNFILKYYADEELRRAIHTQLNKGEAVNGLRDFLTFANEGIIRKKQLEEQMIQASCITLLSNIVMTWNTVYMNEIIRQLIDEGYSINNDDLSRLSPARFQHINPYGKLEFNVEIELNRKGLRPLKSKNNN